MKLHKAIFDSEGWHLAGADVPIQVGFRLAGSEVGPRHLHRTLHEYFLVLEGRIVLEIGGKSITLEEGGLCVVEPGEPHELRERSPDCRLLLLMPRAVPNDKVELPPC